MTNVGRRWDLAVFDLDGTLVDSFRDIVAGIRVACLAIDVPPSNELEKLATRGIPLEDFYLAATGARHDAPGEEQRFARFVDAYRACYLPGCLTTTQPYEGIAGVLAETRRLGMRIAVATTKRTETAGRVLGGTGLLPLIDVYSGSDGLAHKPNPAVLRRVADLAGIGLERGVMIGDTDRDVGAARAAGCAAIGVTWGGFSADEMRALGPDFVVDTPTQLLDALAGG